MKNLKKNLLISIAIVLLYFIGGYLLTFRDDYPGIGFLAVFLIAGIYSIIAGLASAQHAAEAWQGIVFISSCLMNVVLSVVPLAIILDGAHGTSAIALLLMLLFPLTGTLQLIAFFRYYRRAKAAFNPDRSIN